MDLQFSSFFVFIFSGPPFRCCGSEFGTLPDHYQPSNPGMRPHPQELHSHQAVHRMDDTAAGARVGQTRGLLDSTSSPFSPVGGSCWIPPFSFRVGDAPQMVPDETQTVSIVIRQEGVFAATLFIQRVLAKPIHWMLPSLIRYTFSFPSVII